MEYKYKAIRNTGETFEGLFNANSVEEVAQMLRTNQSYPVNIDVYKKTGSMDITIGGAIKPKDLSFFCRQLNAMLNAGSTVLRCLDIMKQQLENKQLRDAVSTMYGDVQKGKILSQSMAEHPKVFPNLMIYMVESGEMSGNLDTILLRLADYYEKDAKLRNKVKSAMVYPIILMILSIVIVIFLVTFIMPTFTEMFESSGVALPGPTQFIMNISNFLRGNAFIVAIGIAIVVLLVWQYVNSETGKRNFDYMKLKLPGLKSLTSKILTARFARNLSTMLSSGVPLLTALDNIAHVISNKVAEEAILKFKEEIQKGEELHIVVRESKLFPPMLDNMMEVGKESGALDNILFKTADYYDDEVDQALQRMTTMFEPIMIVFMAAVIGFIVVSMMLPMFDMANTVQ